MIGDLEHARAVIADWAQPDRLNVAATLTALAGELADLARALNQ